MSKSQRKRRSRVTLAGAKRVEPAEIVDKANPIAVNNALLRRRSSAMATPRNTSANQLLGVEAATVQDPFDGKQLAVTKNLRVHPLDFMAARGRITETQKLAGDRFLAIYDRSEIGGAKAIDYSKVKVDVSFTFDGLDEAAMDATDKLKRICGDIGKRAYALLVSIIGQRMSVSDLSRRLDGTIDDHHARHVAASLKDALDDLDDHFGKARGKVHAVAPYVRHLRPLEGRINMDELVQPELSHDVKQVA